MNKILQQVNNGSRIQSCRLSEDGSTTVIISYAGHYFSGKATIEPEDIDFFSEKVGATIAEKKAKLVAIETIMVNAKDEHKASARMMQEVVTGHKLAEVDPTGLFSQATKRNRALYLEAKEAYHIAYADLHAYIDGQARAIESIKRTRARMAESEQTT